MATAAPTKKATKTQPTAVPTIGGQIELQIENFDKTVTGNTRVEKPRLSDVLAGIRQMNMTPLSDFGSGNDYDRQRARSKALKVLGSAYVSQFVSSRFPIIDPSLFAKKRYIALEFSGSEVKLTHDGTSQPASARDSNIGNVSIRWLEMPLFAKYDFQHNREEGIVELARVTWPRTHSTKSCTVSALFPGLIRGQHMRYANQCRALIYRAAADLFEDHDGCVAAEELDMSISFSAYWIPGTQFLSFSQKPNPDRRDPALVIDWMGHHFLACIWDAGAQEQPVEALLREFTSGGKVNVVK